MNKKKTMTLEEPVAVLRAHHMDCDEITVWQ